jgi:ParB family transcriptional regulator, chromosome partitioning protein
MSAPKRNALGRGLAALIPGAPPPSAPAPTTGIASRRPSDGTRTIAVEEIHPSPGQPRTRFDDARLDELAASIKTQGIIQPLIVRARAPENGGGYELIAGERRWRAAQRAGLHELPAVVRDVAPTQAFEMAMVENLQREDLNPLEEAAGYQRLIEEFGYTQEQLSDRVGKDRSTVANSLRLLRLPDSVRGLLAEGRLSMGHARALLGLEVAAAMEKMARKIVAGELSVRRVEELVRRSRDDSKAPEPAASGPRTPSASARDLAMRLTRTLGTRVEVLEVGKERGQIAIHYHSLDQLDALLERLMQS